MIKIMKIIMKKKRITMKEKKMNKKERNVSFGILAIGMLKSIKKSKSCGIIAENVIISRLQNAPFATLQNAHCKSIVAFFTPSVPNVNFICKKIN